MKVYHKLVAELLVGDYLQVVIHEPGEDNRPVWFRRVEKIEYIDAPADQFFANSLFHFGHDHDLPPWAGAVIVWCHGVGAPLIYPPGDVTVWADVPAERREWDEGSSWWGPVARGSLFPVSREPTKDEVWIAELGDAKNRRGTVAARGARRSRQPSRRLPGQA